MQITNKLVSESFSIEYSGKALTTRETDYVNLDKIFDYCKQIGETVYYDDNLYDTMVEDGIYLYEIIYGIKDGVSKDGADYLRELFGKSKKHPSADENAIIIFCSCGEYSNEKISAAHTLSFYAKERQTYLKNIKNHADYGAFMKSCFPNCVFSTDCIKELAHIKNFSDNVAEITACLSLLNEKALNLYRQYSNDLSKAQAILQSELHRTCAPDPKHKKDLLFEFEYEMDKDNQRKTLHKTIECQPHFKLIRDNSNLRIYFFWKDDDIGNGKKVLIGRIGRHPW